MRNYLARVVLVLTFALMIATSKVAVGQGPEAMNYQGVLTDSTGAPVATGIYNMTFRIYNDSLGGDELYSESQAVDVTDGRFNVALPFSHRRIIWMWEPDGSDSEDDWRVRRAWLEAQVEGDAPLSPRMELQAVPYAFVAQSIQGGVMTGPGYLAIPADNTFPAGDTLPQMPYHMTVEGENEATTLRMFAPGACDTCPAIEIVADTSGGNIGITKFFDEASPKLYMALTDDGGKMGIATDQSGNSDTCQISIPRDPQSGQPTGLQIVRTDVVLDETHRINLGIDTSGAGLGVDASGNVDTCSIALSADLDNGAELGLRFVDNGVAGSSIGMLADANSASINITVNDSQAPTLQMRADANSAYFNVTVNDDQDPVVAIRVDSAGGRIILAGSPTDTTVRITSDGSAFFAGEVQSGNSLSMHGNLHEIRTTSGEMYLGRHPNSGSFEDVKLGVGTTSPAFTLDVNGDGRVYDSLEVRSSGFGNRWYRVTSGARQEIRTGNDLVTYPGQNFAVVHQNGDFLVGPVEGNYTLIVDGSTERVGIGTSSPSEKLHVVGNICYTGTIGACSDGRYKTDVATIAGALDRLRRLRGVVFNWKREEFPELDFPEDRQVGFIAQELKDVLPEVVSQGGNGYYSVDYGRLTPLLVEALKEQQREIDELKAIVDRLVEDQLAARE